MAERFTCVLVLAACGSEAGGAVECDPSERYCTSGGSLCAPSYFVEDGEECGEVSDETWINLAGSEDRVEIDDASAPQILVPQPGQAFSSADAAPTLSWQLPERAMLPPGMRRSIAPVAAGEPPFWRRVLAELTLVKKAWAHCPTTGEAFVAEIRATGRDCPIVHLTGHGEWQISDDEWGTLKSLAGTDLTFGVTFAYMTGNVITEGPFRVSTPVEFEVTE